MAWVLASDFGTKYKLYPSEVFKLVTKALFSGEKEIFVEDPVFQKILEENEEQARRNFVINETSKLNNIGIQLERELEVDTAISVYEENIAYRPTATHSYDKLIAIYRRNKDLENEKRVLSIALDVFTKENQKRYRNSVEISPELNNKIDEYYYLNKIYRNNEGQVIFNPYNISKYIKRLNQIEKL